MSVTLPEPILPDLSLPDIRNLPGIPLVGCAGGSGGTYIGEQFGNLPDLDAVLHIKARKKQLEEMIETLIEGYVPAAARAPVWAQRVLAYTTAIAELVSTLTALVNAASAEINEAINFANDKIGEFNQAKDDILSVPEGARTAAQRLLLQRYDEYTAEITDQVGRLQDSLSCLSS